MKVSQLFVIVFCLFSFQLMAQDARIIGKVINTENNKTIEGADVFIKGSSMGVSTNKNGQFTLKGLEAGKSYTITAFYLGMAAKEQTITCKAGKNILNFKLKPFADLLDEVYIQDQETSDIVRLQAVEGTAIFEGKKSEVILIDNITANLATNNSRQIYNKVPGLNIWESDGAGIQLGIGGRGLNPSRTSNFNTRQNGYDIAADALGYPESYYTPPLEAVEKIQMVRGAASLQYGTQFGGLLNFEMKKGPEDKPISFTTRQTGGSYGLFNSFNSLGGTLGKKLNYYTFYQYKRGDGWRENSDFDVHTFFGGLSYQINDKLKLGLEFTHMNYLSQQAGGLTDAEFEIDPRASYTEKDWFAVDWNIASLSLEYKFNPQSQLEFKGFGLYASREALGINHRSDFPEFDPRLLVKDRFRNIGMESRFLHRYNLGSEKSVFLVGVRLYRGFDIKQQGEASAENDADFRFSYPDSLLADHNFYIHNTSVFVENIFNISEKFSITPGIRFENIGTIGEGYYLKQYQQVDENGLLETVMVSEPDTISKYRNFVIFGLGMSFKPKENMEIYANLSQNYRAITYSDLRTLNTNIRIDPDLEDEKGYSADIGFRGNNELFNYDFSVFYLRYNNKIGLANPANPIRTNISDAYTTGIESYAEVDLFKLFNESAIDKLGLFGNLAVISGQYVSDESIYDGNQVELVPPFNAKVGLNYNHRGFSASWQYSYIAKQYTDAFNTETPLADAVYGPIPAYYVTDLSLKYQYKFFLIESGVNNLTDNYYFTRRATGYPGPGIIPADGRNFYLTLQLKL